MARDGEGLDLTRFETPVIVRNTTPADFDDVIALQERCFPGMRPWKPAQLALHLERFPEGQFVVLVEGECVGSASSLIVDFEEFEDDHSFDEISGHGTLETHDPEGEDLYGIEVMVDPEYRGMRIGERLYQARRELAEGLNLQRILIAGRMPRYHEFADSMSPKEYVHAVLQSEIKDPVLGFQLRNGFVPKRVLEGYLPKDQESKGHAVLLEWNNIEYRRQGRKRLKGAEPVRITVIQYQMRKVATFREFARQTEYFVEVAANYDSDFAVFPELLTTQLLSSMEERDPARAVRLLSKHTNDYLEHFTDLAVRYNVNILGGTHIVEEEGRLHNVAFLFRRDGTIDRQYKLHITANEHRWWGITGGDDLRILETDVGRIAIHVCYDIEFPELSRIAVDRGANILFVPFCTEDRQGYLRVRYCAQARAIENQVYVVMAGTVGNLPDSRNMDIQYAQSHIFTPSDFSFPPDGVAAATSPNVETIIVGDVDLAVLRRHRRAGSVTQLADRRPDLYEVVDKRRQNGDDVSR